ncbi:hypothetical protein Hanom_Chr17g01584111 [Helianthus anomalus]
MMIITFQAIFQVTFKRAGPNPNESKPYPRAGKGDLFLNNADIAALKDSDAFPVGVVIRPFDWEVQSDATSNEWVYFFAYPFTLRLRYPFPSFISRFFEFTGLSYAQTMPMVWRVLMVLNQISRHCPDLCIEDLPIAYGLRSHGNSCFLLFSTSKNPLILKATKNEDQWSRKFFFVKGSLLTRASTLKASN